MKGLVKKGFSAVKQIFSDDLVDYAVCFGTKAAKLSLHLG